MQCLGNRRRVNVCTRIMMHKCIRRLLDDLSVGWLRYELLCKLVQSGWRKSQNGRPRSPVAAAGGNEKDRMEQGRTAVPWAQAESPRLWRPQGMVCGGHARQSIPFPWWQCGDHWRADHVASITYNRSHTFCNRTQFVHGLDRLHWKCTIALVISCTQVEFRIEAYVEPDETLAFIQPSITHNTSHTFCESVCT